MRWSRVTRRHERVVVCGQGPSWADVDTEQLRKTIASGAVPIFVNGAVDSAGPLIDYRLPEDQPAYWFTLDPSLENLARMASPFTRISYLAAVPEDYEQRFPIHQHVSYLRRVVRENPDPGSAPFAERVLSQIVGGLSEDPGAVHTGNSGFGALGLAYLMRARRVVLLGIDGRGHRRWDGTENQSLDHLPDLFAGAVEQLKARGVEVVNGCPTSAVTCFPKMSAEEALAWVMRAG